MVSACLAGENCKYNGGNNRNEKVLQLMEENEVITVCPEQMGGLPTPRVPSEVRDGVVTARDGRIVDKEFRAGAAKCLEIALREKPDLIVLQSLPCAVREELADAVCARHKQKSQLRGETAVRRHIFRNIDGWSRSDRAAAYGAWISVY